MEKTSLYSQIFKKVAKHTLNRLFKTNKPTLTHSMEKIN